MIESRSIRLAAAALALAIAGLLAGAAGAQAQSTGLQAAFEFAPATPKPGEEITFTATTTSASTEPIRHSWDLDGDGQFDDGAGDSVKTSFAVPGRYKVALRARQQSPLGIAESVAERDIEVGAVPDEPAPEPTPEPQPAPNNQPPVAVYDRQCKKTGTFVLCGGLVAREGVPTVLKATASHDPDGQIVKYEWDLDANGQFEIDAGTKPTVTHTFEALNNTLIDTRKRTVRVRVTDDRGATAVDEAKLNLLEPACQPGMSHGALKLTSTCVRKRKLAGGGSRWYGEHPVVLNGITIAPKGHSIFVLDIPQNGPPEIKVNRAVVTVPVKGSTAKLVDGHVAWKVAGGRLSGFEVSDSARLNGLRITGMPGEPELAAGGTSKLAVFVALPKQFGGNTSDEPITLRPGATASAAAGKPLSFGVENAALGPIDLQELRVTYDGVDLWEIKAKVGLPDPIPYTVSGEAGIRGGEFEHAGAAIDFGTPGVGPFGPVMLQRIGFRVEVKPKKSKCVPNVGVQVIDQNKMLKDYFGVSFNPPLPDLKIDHGVPTFALCGDVRLTAGPEVFGVSAISLDAGLGLATYADRPSVLRAFGEVSLVEIPLANASMEVHTNGYTRMRANVHWGIPDVASISGFLMFEALFPKFNAKAYVEACVDFVDWCAGAKAIVSSKGVAVCLKIDVLVDDWEPGFGYRWGEEFPTLYFAGCELGPYTEHIKRPGAGTATAAAAGDARTLDLPGGLPGAAVVLEGKDAPPKVTLVGPKGERITTPDGLMPVEQSPFFILKDPRAKLTQVAISKPSAGRWRIEVEPGSSEIVSMKSAEGLEQPKVDARVTGRGHRRALAYEVEQRPGQKVTFMERGPSAGNVIGEPRSERGTLRFTPADGQAERREIVAIVSQDGQVRDELTVARYRAPSAAVPGKPRQLRVRRTGRRLVASWRPAAQARRYAVAVRLSDGRRLNIATGQRRMVVRGVRRGVRGSVRVRGLSASTMKGRAASVRIGGRR
jgi:plastocyanin